jgi:hypothetical protein
MQGTSARNCSRFTSLVDRVLASKYTGPWPIWLISPCSVGVRTVMKPGNSSPPGTRGPGHSIPARRWPAVTLAVLALSLTSACRRDAADDGAAVRRYRFARVGFDARGLSRLIHVEVPERTRSIAIIAEGAPDTLFALAELRTADGVDQVALPAGVEPGAAMRAAYFDEQSGQMPGAQRQAIRLGLFSHIYPDRPGADLPAGGLALRIASSEPSRTVDVEVLLPEEIGATILPINVITVSSAGVDRPPDPETLPFLDRLRSIMAGGGVELRVEHSLRLADEDLAGLSELSAPQEPPGSDSARLALLGGAMVAGDALNLFIVDALPDRVGGWTLGTPGPPRPDTYYSGVVAARLDGGDELARVLAHEICHYLGLWHVAHTSSSGALNVDPLDDTEPHSGNLMDEDGTGTLLTPDQSYVLARHPLLTANRIAP